MSPAAAAIRRPLPRTKADIRGLRSYLLNGLASTSNAVKNGGLETNATGWSSTGTGATVVRVTTNHLFGAGGLSITTTGSANSGAKYDDAGARIPAVAGASYVASTYLQGTLGTEVGITIEINWIDAGAGTISTVTSAQLSLSTGWQRLQISGVAPALTVTAQIRIVQQGASTQVWFADGIQFETGSSATAYVETDGAVAAARPCQRLWLMQEPVGAATAVDECGNANGTYTSCTLGKAGLMGRAVGFDGSASVISMSSGADAAKTVSAITVVALVKPLNTAASLTVYSEDTNTTDGTSRLELLGNIAASHVTRLNVRPSTAEASQTSSGTSKRTGLWNLMGWAVDMANDAQYHFINGLLVTTTAAAFTATTFENANGTGVPTIGEDIGTASRFWNGDMNFVAIFNRLLTQGEMREIARRCGF